MIDSLQDVDNLLGEFRGLNSSGLVPAIDIYEDQDSIIAEAPLPGIDIKDVKVSVENDTLTIEGSSKKSTEIDEKNYYRKEIRSGSFHRVVQLPVAVDGSKTRGTYEDGVLKVVMPKRDELKSKTIDIEIKK